MNIDDFSFHDSTILEVKEFSEDQSLEFLIDFPTDWENNLFEKKILRFSDVTYYCIEEIPFAGNPTILEIINMGEITKTFGSGKNEINIERQKIQILTNAGNRFIEFTSCILKEIEC